MSDKNSDFLSDMVKDNPAESDIEPNEAPEPKEAKAETGDPAQPETKAEGTPPPETHTESSTVPLAALKAEREKRQANEQKVKELERQLAERQKAPEAEKAPADFFESPEGYVQHAVTEVQRQAQERLYAVLDAEAREAYPDYDEVMEVVTQRVTENPALKQQIFSAANPAKAAYRLGKQFKELEAMQDPVAYRERIRAELRAEIEADINSKAAAKRQADSALPPDLASTRSNAGTSPPESDVFETTFDK